MTLAHPALGQPLAERGDRDRRGLNGLKEPRTGLKELDPVIPKTRGVPGAVHHPNKSQKQAH